MNDFDCPIKYSPSNLKRMRKGLAPQRISPITGKLESKELHLDPPKNNSELLSAPERGSDEAFNVLYTYDDFQCGDSFRFLITFGDINTKLTLGVQLDVSGHFVLDGQRYRNRMILWKKPDVSEVVFEAWHNNPFQRIFGPKLPEGILRVRTIWDGRDGKVRSKRGAASLNAQPINSGKLYRCHTAHQNSSFSDLCFAIQRFELVEK